VESNLFADSLSTIHGSLFFYLVVMFREKDIAIKCPHCGKEAVFRSAFVFLLKEQKEELERTHKYTGEFLEYENGYIHNKYPERFEYPRDKYNGMAICCECSYNKEHILDWSKDFYYEFSVDETRVWAYNRDQMVALYDYVASKHRDMNKYGHHYDFLYNIPRFMYTKKKREKVLKEMKRNFFSTQ